MLVFVRSQNSLSYLVLSENQISGSIPVELIANYSSDPFIGNKNLCGDIKGFPPCLPSSQIMRLIKKVVPLIVFFALLLVYFFHSRRWVWKTQSMSRGAKNWDLFSIWNYDGKIAYDDIIKATKDFDIKYCIGTGSYGSVYKAQLPSGNVVALKKLHRLEAEDPNFNKSFRK